MSSDEERETVVKSKKREKKNKKRKLKGAKKSPTKKRRVNDDDANMSGTKLTGRVSFYNVSNRYGFIEPDDGSKDIFFAHRHIHCEDDEEEKSVANGAEVEFEIGIDRKGKKMANST